jgi:serine/threonine-protein kinase
MTRVARQLGRYHVLDRIAYGGMAEIFRALTFEDSGRGVLVGIKQVLPHYAEDPEFIEMLVDEASLISMLHHPNIIETFEVGNVDDVYFLAMEFVWGKDLRSVLERCRSLGTRLPYEVSAHILSEALAGLDTAHRLLDASGNPASLVHRDFSPSNILISYNGDVKICDFGIAKANFSSKETKTGVIKGKVKYMSPEQAYGRKLDHRSDVFSAGSVFYEMLTNQPPFIAGNEIDLIFLVRDAHIVPVAQLAPDVPSQLEKLVYRSMARARSQRYQSAAEFRHGLVRYLSNRGAGDWKAELTRFMRGLYMKEIVKERVSLGEYVLETGDGSVANLGRNLIAEVLGRDAAYTKFNPYPTRARDVPSTEEGIHDASTRIVSPAELSDARTAILGAPYQPLRISDQETRILAPLEEPGESRTLQWEAARNPLQIHEDETGPRHVPQGGGAAPGPDRAGRAQPVAASPAPVPGPVVTPSGSPADGRRRLPPTQQGPAARADAAAAARQRPQYSPAPPVPQSAQVPGPVRPALPQAQPFGPAQSPAPPVVSPPPRAGQSPPPQRPGTESQGQRPYSAPPRQVVQAPRAMVPGQPALRGAIPELRKTLSGTGLPMIPPPASPPTAPPPSSQPVPFAPAVRVTSRGAVHQPPRPMRLDDDELEEEPTRVADGGERGAGVGDGPRAEDHDQSPSYPSGLASEVKRRG